MGAIGYAVKPTTREQLKEVFRRLEAKLTQKIKRVLLVEDDDRQRDSMVQLIGDDDVEITAVARRRWRCAPHLRLHDHRPQAARHAGQRAAQRMTPRNRCASRR
jgi:YesN/AraC family two-component response regulator